MTTPSQPNREIPKRVQLNKIILEKSGIEGLKLLNEYEKELVESQVAQALAEQREELLKRFIEAAEPYDGSKWHNRLTLEHIKKTIASITEPKS